MADDIESVRTALGVDKINLFGNSYAGNDVVTYAVRHRAHVRSVVHDLRGAHPWRGHVLGVGPPSPAGHHPHPVRPLGVVCRRRQLSDLGAGLARGRRCVSHPLHGTYVDGEGITHGVQLTEAKLLNWLLPNPGYEWAGPGEVAQAARAFRGGDPTALLRLAGQNDLEPGPAGFDPTFFSTGHNLARRCVDEPFPWVKSAGLGAAHGAVRQGTRRAAGRSTARSPRMRGCVPSTAGVVQNLMQPDPCIASTWVDVPAFPGRDDGAARARRW